VKVLDSSQLLYDPKIIRAELMEFLLYSSVTLKGLISTRSKPEENLFSLCLLHVDCFYFRQDNLCLHIRVGGSRRHLGGDLGRWNGFGCAARVDEGRR